MPSKSQRALLAFTGGGLIGCAVMGFCVTLGLALLFDQRQPVSRVEVVNTNHPSYDTMAMGSHASNATLSTVFTPEVLYWEQFILAWAQIYNVNPNLIATLIQIESCGDPLVSSSAGAQGLFQVMPFHFEDGEDMLDVQTNARRGMTYLVGGLQRANGHIGLALAGYNGGHGIIDSGWASWAKETQRYYYWGSRIYFEAVTGRQGSEALDEWLKAGGQHLCLQAHERQKNLDLETQVHQDVGTAS